MNFNCGSICVVVVVVAQVHVSLSSREAEVEYLEDLSHRLVPLLLLRRRIAASRLASHLASALLTKKLLLTLLDSLCDPRQPLFFI